MVVVALLSVDLVESVDLVSVDLVVNCTRVESNKASIMMLNKVNLLHHNVMKDFLQSVYVLSQKSSLELPDV